MKISKFVFAAAVWASPAFGCDFCALYSATSVHEGSGFFAGAAEQFTHFGTALDRGHEVRNETGQALDSSITQFIFGYNFNQRFGLQLNAPLIVRSFKRPEGFTIDRGTEVGLGDVALIGRYTPYRHLTEDTTVLGNLLGGVKFPTGNPHRLREELNEVEIPGAPESGIHGHDLTLGSGSFDGIIGTSLYARHRRAFFSAEIQYSLRSEGSIGYQFANELTWSAGPGVLLMLRENFTLSLQGKVSGEAKPRDTFRGETANDTGITAVYLGPEILATWQDKLSAELGLDVPVSIDNTAFQVVPDYRVRAALTWHF